MDGTNEKRISPYTDQFMIETGVIPYFCFLPEFQASIGLSPFVDFAKI